MAKSVVLTEMPIWFDRYYSIRSSIQTLVEACELESKFPDNFDVLELALYRAANTDCVMEDNLKRIENGRFGFLYRLGLFKHALYLKYQFLKPKLESYPSFRKSYANAQIIDRLNNAEELYVASLPNYANFLVKNVWMRSASRTKLLVAPQAICTELVKRFQIRTNDCIHLEELLAIANMENGGQNPEVSISYKKRSHAVRAVMQYRRINYAAALRGLLLRYFSSFDWQCNLVNFLHENLVLANQTSIIVARDRRHLENIFLQVLRYKGAKTKMYPHGMLSSNFEITHLFTSNYKFIDEVWCWGPQQEDVIRLRQNTLGEHLPAFKRFNEPLKALPKQKNAIRNGIIFVGEGINDAEIFHLANKVADLNMREEYQLIFRPLKALKFKSNATRSGMLIVDQKPNFFDRYSGHGLIVVGASSTLVLETMVDGALGLLLKDSYFAHKKPGFYFFEANRKSVASCEDGFFFGDQKSLISKICELTGDQASKKIADAKAKQEKLIEYFICQQ